MLGAVWVVGAVGVVSGHALAAFKYSLNTYKRSKNAGSGVGGGGGGWCGR